MQDRQREAINKVLQTEEGRQYALERLMKYMGVSSDGLEALDTRIRVIELLLMRRMMTTHEELISMYNVINDEKILKRESE